jgi:hypothetical protein
VKIISGIVQIWLAIVIPVHAVINKRRRAISARMINGNKYSVAVQLNIVINIPVDNYDIWEF